MKKVQKITFWEKYKHLVSAFSTKALGNVSFRTGNREIIQANKNAFVEELGISWGDVLVLPLSHSNKVLSLSLGTSMVRDSGGVYKSGGHIFSAQEIIHNNSEWQSGIDAVVTNVQGLFPIIMSADCAAVGLFDQHTGVFAMAHTGLIGAVNKIVPKTIQCMVDEYGSDCRNIEVVLFPSIRRCHYDLNMSGVWELIKTDSLTYYGKSNPVFADEKFDLQGLIRNQLIESGITGEHIHDTNLCTVCKHDMFFSNLAAGNTEAKKNEGRFASIMGVRNEK